MSEPTEVTPPAKPTDQSSVHEKLDWALHWVEKLLDHTGIAEDVKADVADAEKTSEDLHL